MPVVRHAVLASSFGLRFQEPGHFLTDARAHRVTRAASMVMQAVAQGALPWVLLGMHPARHDLGSRDRKQD